MKRIAVTAPYGSYVINGVKKPHYGIDICAQSDRTVSACHAGSVLFSGYDSAGGNMIVILGPFNAQCQILTRYAHLAHRSVSAGQTVSEGQTIGEQGATGSACLGRHLHLETWLVPNDYSYSYSDRARYSVDPIGVLHVTGEQFFLSDADTFDFLGIEQPEPRPADLRALAAGSYVEIKNKKAQLRYYPSIDIMPLIGAADRSRYALADYCSLVAGVLPARYACTTVGRDSVTRRWAMVESAEIGLWWLEMTADGNELHEAVAQGDEITSQNASAPDSTETDASQGQNPAEKEGAAPDAEVSECLEQLLAACESVGETAARLRELIRKAE